MSRTPTRHAASRAGAPDASNGTPFIAGEQPASNERAFANAVAAAMLLVVFFVAPSFFRPDMQRIWVIRATGRDFRAADYPHPSVP
jgi:hypothetical protein